MSHSSRFLKISLSVLVIMQLIAFMLIIDKISGNTIIKIVIDAFNISSNSPLPDLLGYIELSFVTAIGAAGAWVAISIASNTEKLLQFANTLQEKAIKNESPDYLAAKCITANIQKLEAITSQFFGYGEYYAEATSEEAKDHYYIRQLNIIDECISHVDTHTMLYRFSRQLEVAEEYKSLQSSILKLIVKVQYTNNDTKKAKELNVLASRIYQYIRLIKWCTQDKISPSSDTVEGYYFSLSPLQYLNGSDLLNQHTAVIQTLFPMHQFLPANALEML